MAAEHRTEDDPGGEEVPVSEYLPVLLTAPTTFGGAANNPFAMNFTAVGVSPEIPQIPQAPATATAETLEMAIIHELRAELLAMKEAMGKLVKAKSEATPLLEYWKNRAKEESEQG
jgi:hypothetical protein